MGKHCFYRFLYLKNVGKKRYFKSSSAVCLVNMKGRFKAASGGGCNFVKCFFFVPTGPCCT